MAQCTSPHRHTSHPPCPLADSDPEEEPNWLSKALLGPGSHLALAILCSKVMIPIKVPAAAVLTPYIYRCAAGGHGGAFSVLYGPRDAGSGC